MTVRRVRPDTELHGFSALAAGTLFNLANIPMTYEQRWWSLDAVYYFALAKIEEDEKYNTDPKITMVVSGIRVLLDQANHDYKPQFESHTSSSDLENRYKELLSQIFGTTTGLMGKTHIIEHVKLEQEVFG